MTIVISLLSTPNSFFSHRLARTEYVLHDAMEPTSPCFQRWMTMCYIRSTDFVHLKLRSCSSLKSVPAE